MTTSHLLKKLKKTLKPVVKKTGYLLISCGGKIISSLNGKEWYEFPRDFVFTEIRPKFLDEEDFLEHLKPIKNKCAFGKKGPLPLYRLYILWQLIKSSRNIKGDIVEFGSYRGGTAYIISAASHQESVKRQIYLYDTFEGLPDQGLTEGEKISQFQGRFGNTSIEAVKDLLNPFISRIHIIAGIIPESLQDKGPQHISFMHLDLNAAQPTLDTLIWAYPRWTSGGICLLDDYLDKEYREQRILVEKFFNSKNLEIIGLPTGQGIVMNRW